MTSADAPPPEAWLEWGGSGPLFVFGHANGFSPETYRVLFEALGACFRVTSFAARPLWGGSDPQAIADWRDLADDLRRGLVRRGGEPVVGAGHSLGSVLNVLAAAAEPALFRALVMVDPVIFSGPHSLFWGAFKGLGLGHRLPLIRGARRRRERFPSREHVRAAYRGKPAFRTWRPEVLDDYVDSGFIDEEDGGVRLRYPKAWEARIFEITPAEDPSKTAGASDIALPMLIIRGAGSDTFRASAAARARRELPTATVVELPRTTHFVPMEQPQEVAASIVTWWQGL